MPNKNQRAQRRDSVETLKLSEARAKYFEAEYKTMYYALEAEKIRPAYEKFLQEKHPELFESLQQEVIEQESEVPAGDATQPAEPTLADADIKE